MAGPPGASHCPQTLPASARPIDGCNAAFGVALDLQLTLLRLPGDLDLGGDGAGPVAFAPLMTGRNLGIFGAPILAGWLIGTSGWPALATTFAAITVLATATGLVMATAVAHNRRP